jgi:6-phosphogluconolactonase
MKPCSTFRGCVELFVKDIAGCLKTAINSRSHATLAVSGGRTPEKIFPSLAQEVLDWDRVVITLADERWVPPDHADSNEALTRKLLMKGPASVARFVGLKTHHGDPFEGLDGCARRLDTLNWPLDVVFLGMGEDGHIASLFPGRSDWTDAPGKVMGVVGSQGRHPRMSLTPAALLNSNHIIVVINGAEKRAAFDAAMEPGPISDYPIRLLLHQKQVPVTIYAAD